MKLDYTKLDYFIRHLGTHTGEKVKQMQPMRLCIFLGTHFEGTFEDAQWQKVVQMQLVHCQLQCSGVQIPSAEKGGRINRSINSGIA